MKTLSKKFVIILIIVIALIVIAIAYGVYGLVAGFYPFEQNIIIRNAEKYVIKTYDLTPIKVQVTTLYLWFPVTIRIQPEQNDFWFQLRTGRFFYGVKHFVDDYLENMTGHILSRDLSAYVEEVTNSQGSVWVDITTGKTGILSQFSLAELEENPNIAFEKLKGKCRVGIKLYDGTEKEYDLNHDLDFNLVYDIYKKAFELGLEPYYISFSYNNIRGESRKAIYAAIIDNKFFPTINSPEDLVPIFQDEMNKRIGYGW